MKEAIQKIRKLLKANAYTDEQHVRFSLVGLICQKLGWDVWDPREFHTEYRVEKLQGASGRVDVALFLPDRYPKAAQVFMEIKAPGKLIPALVECETQLHEYHGYHNIAIGILTDGIIWRFYVPSIGGYFHETLFAERNIERDDIDDLVTFFNEVLHRDNFRKKAQNRAEQIYDELRKIKLVQKVKPNAVNITKLTGESPYVVAQNILNHKEGKDMDVEEIKYLWDKNIPYESEQTSTPTKVYAPPTTPTPLTRNKVRSVPTVTKTPIYTDTDNIRFSIRTKSLNAWGYYHANTEQFTLCRGSEIAKNHKDSLERQYVERKKNMIRTAKLQLNSTGTKYVLMEDSLFSSPSAASRFVVGRSSSGNKEWIDENGRCLGDYR